MSLISYTKEEMRYRRKLVVETKIVPFKKQTGIFSSDRVHTCQSEGVQIIRVCSLIRPGTPIYNILQYTGTPIYNIDWISSRKIENKIPKKENHFMGKVSFTLRLRRFRNVLLHKDDFIKNF